MNMDEEKYIRELSIEELRIERARYSLLVDSDIKSMKFNDNIHNKIISFIIFTVLLNAIFCYAGLSDESNIYTFLSKHNLTDYIGLLLFIIPLAIHIIYSVSLMIGIINKKKKLSIESLTVQIKQDELFKEFIKRKIEKIEGKSIDDIIQLSEVIFRKNIYDIKFNQDDFRNYIFERLERYSKKFSLNFKTNYSELILLNQCIEGVLIQNKSKYSAEYILIIDKNINIL